MKRLKYKEYLSKTIPGIFYGVICGLVVGVSIFFFKMAARYAEDVSRYIYGAAKSSPLLIALVFVVLAGFALLMVLLHKFIPESKGGGIPRSEGVIRGILSFRAAKALIGTFIGSMMSYLCGVPLGSEGPAVLIGTSLGSICTASKKNKLAWERYVMSGGAGAGFAVATGAPLSGILFAMEEIHRRFTPMLVLTVSVSVVSATAVNKALSSLFDVNEKLFEFGALAGFEIKHIGYLLLLGVIISLAVCLFDTSIAYWSKFVGNILKKYDNQIKLVIVFLLTGIMGFFLSDGIYSGHDVIENVIENSPGLPLLLVLFAIRLIMMLLITDSGVTGGIFIPTLAIGILASAISTKILILLGMSESVASTAILLGMCAFIGGTLRAPLTASVLFVELTGQFTDIFYVALVIFTVSALTELYARTPFYDTALETIKHAQNGEREPEIALFEMTISEGAFVAGKAIRDIMWPHASVVLSITHGSDHHRDTDNDGEGKLYAGDTLVMRISFFDEDEIKKQLLGIVGSDYPITRKEL